MRVIRMAAVVLAAVCLSIGMTSPVDAAPRIKTTSVVAAVAPSCVLLQQWYSDGRIVARATNWCGYTVRFRMIWAWQLDGPCVALGNGQSYYESRSRIFPYPWPYVSELRSC